MTLTVVGLAAKDAATIAYTLEAENAYNGKDALKAAGYRWNANGKVWTKDFTAAVDMADPKGTFLGIVNTARNEATAYGAELELNYAPLLAVS